MDVSEIIEKGGGVLRLSGSCGVHYTSVIGWRNANRVPAQRVIAVERATGVPRHEIRADIYPDPSGEVGSSCSAA
jgi:DNA-binding transcriptional regulator YdaS (Cro superfamily)